MSKNPIAKKLRSRTYKPKVIESKRLYNRKKEKHATYKKRSENYESHER